MTATIYIDRNGITPEIEERFWSYADKSGGNEACWLWMKAKRNGYGVFTINGRLVGAHRIAATIHYGTINNVVNRKTWRHIP